MKKIKCSCSKCTILKSRAIRIEIHVKSERDLLKIVWKAWFLMVSSKEVENIQEIMCI